MMMMSSKEDWAGLPHNILDEILDRLVALSDYIRFGAVCVPWRSATLDDRNYRGIKNQRRSRPVHNHDHHQLPLLMLPHWLDEDRAQFYSVTQEKILDFQLQVPSYSKRFIGSSFGWLISVETDFAVTLFNPFSSSSTIIRLPPVITPKEMREDEGSFDFETLHLYYFNHEYYIVKAILSADPALLPDEYVVMVIHGQLRRIAFIRPGAAGAGHWTYLDTQMQGFSDVIYSRSSRLFYALHATGLVCWINIDDEYMGDVFTPTLEIRDPQDLRYIVETRSGDLLQVFRLVKSLVKSHGANGVYVTEEITVFKLDKSTPAAWHWAELKSLGDYALFLGDSTSMCVDASDFPGCCPGSICFLLPYFTHLLGKKDPSQDLMPCDMAVANVEGKPSEPFHIRYECNLLSAIPRRPPIWVLPTFQGHKKKRGGDY